MMRTTVHYFIAIVLLAVGANTQAALPTIDVSNKASLQRGAKLYMNYCSGCHALAYLRYNQMAGGLGLIGFDGRIDTDLLKNNLIFTTAEINDPIRIALPPEDAKQWFGVVPPDLSLIAKEKGAQWIYAYLQSFYNDKSRPFGTNNLLKPGVAMPNILESLVGEMVLEHNAKECLPQASLIKEGGLPQAQIDGLLQDLVTFLVFAAEPTQTIRYHLGRYVLIFLGIFLLVVVALKRSYWRNLSKIEHETNIR